MSAILNMPKLTSVLDRETIAQSVTDIAEQISEDYSRTDLVIVGVLKGAFIFLSDLVRQLRLDTVTIEFVQLSSYEDGTATSGNLRLLMDIEKDIAGKHVLIVEDILDTGCTLAFLAQHIKAKKPHEVKTCVLIDKSGRRLVDFEPDYVCHKVKEGFLVGYGLDYAEAYRNLPEIYKINL